MFHRTLRFLVAGAILLPALAVAAQITTTSTTTANTNQPKVQRAEHHSFTAEFNIRHVQTLPNGTTITTEFTEIQAWGTSGRHMYSITQLSPEESASANSHGNAEDPIAGTQSNWDGRSKAASVLQLPPLDERHGCWADETGMTRMSWFDREHPAPPRPQNAAPPQTHRRDSKTEELGTTVIEGMEAKGQRVTTTIPAGQIGNDQPIAITDEHWWSQELGVGLWLRSVNDDPRTGTVTHELTKLTRGEPDPALFQPPDGYKVKTIELHQVECKQQ